MTTTTICPRCKSNVNRPGGNTCWDCLPGADGDGIGKGTHTEEINRKDPKVFASNRRKHEAREAAAKAAGRFV